MEQKRSLEEKRMQETHSALLRLQEKPSPTYQTPPSPHLTHVLLFGSYSFFRLFRWDGCFGLCFICTFIRRLWGLISWAVWDLEMKEVDDSSLATENRWPHPLDTAHFLPYAQWCGVDTHYHWLGSNKTCKSHIANSDVDLILLNI